MRNSLFDTLSHVYIHYLTRPRWSIDRAHLALFSPTRSLVRRLARAIMHSRVIIQTFTPNQKD